MKSKVIYTDNSLESSKACEDLSWNHCTSTPHRSETNGIAENSSAQRKGRHLCCIVTIGSEWKLVGRFEGMLHFSAKRHVTVLFSDGKTPCDRRFGQTFKRQIIPFGSLVEYHPSTAKDQSRIHQFAKKILPRLFLGYVLYAGGIWKCDTDCRPWGVGDDGRIKEMVTLSVLENQKKITETKIYHTHHLTTQEYFRCKNSRWLHSNKQESQTMPLRHWSDFKQALSTLQRLQQEAKKNTCACLLLQTPTMGGTMFKIHIVELAKFMVDSLSFRKSKKICTKYWVNGATLCLQYLASFFDKTLKTIILLQIDRLQLTAVYCNRRRV